MFHGERAVRGRKFGGQADQQATLLEVTHVANLRLPLTLMVGVPYPISHIPCAI